MRRSTKVGTQHSPGFVLLDSARNTPQNSRIISVAGHTISVSSLSASFTTHGHGIDKELIKLNVRHLQRSRTNALLWERQRHLDHQFWPCLVAVLAGWEKGGSWTGGPGASVMDFSF